MLVDSSGTDTRKSSFYTPIGFLPSGKIGRGLWYPTERQRKEGLRFPWKRLGYPKDWQFGIYAVKQRLH